MTSIGFIGLGVMGTPMAAHLVRAGYQVRGYDLRSDAMAELVDVGGTAAGSLDDAVGDAEVVITMLPQDSHVEQVVLGPEGVLRRLPAGRLLIDMSTVSPATSRAVAEAGQARAVRVLDAPVSGGQAGAVEGALSIMIGGQEADVAAARPLLETFGTTIVHVGPYGAGQMVKAANQLLVGGILALNAEALVLMESAGVDPQRGLDVLNGGLAASTVLSRKKTNFLKRSYQPGFRIDLHHKDMGIVQAAAQDEGVSLPLTSQVSALVAAARAQGLGDADHSALLAVVEAMNGRSESEER